MLVDGHQTEAIELPHRVDFVPLEDISSRLAVPMRGLKVVDLCIKDNQLAGSQRFYSQVDLVSSGELDDYFLARHIRSLTDPNRFVIRLSSPGSGLFNWLESIGTSLPEKSLVLSWRITSPRLALSAASRRRLA